MRYGVQLKLYGSYIVQSLAPRLLPPPPRAHYFYKCLHTVYGRDAGNTTYSFSEVFENRFPPPEVTACASSSRPPPSVFRSSTNRKNDSFSDRRPPEDRSGADRAVRQSVTSDARRTHNTVYTSANLVLNTYC